VPLDTGATLRIDARKCGRANGKERMARPRYQDGSLFIRGKRIKVWAARWREDVIREDGTLHRTQPTVVLGALSELSHREARSLLKRHDGLRVDSPPRREFLLHESASICPGEYRAGALSNACASSHRPRKPEHVIGRLLVGSLRAFRDLFPLWPRCASPEMHLIPNGHLIQRRLAVDAHSCVSSDARHAVVMTLCSRACRVVLVRPSFALRGLFESASCKL